MDKSSKRIHFLSTKNDVVHNPEDYSLMKLQVTTRVSSLDLVIV